MKTVELEVAVVGSTDAAIKVDYGGKFAVWIPKSQISDYCGDSLEEAESIFIPEWLALEKGLI